MGFFCGLGMSVVVLSSIVIALRSGGDACNLWMLVKPTKKVPSLGATAL